MMLGIEEKCAATIAHDHIYGKFDLMAVIFMNSRLARKELDLSNGINPQATLSQWAEA